MTRTKLPAASLLAILTAATSLAVVGVVAPAHAESCGMGEVDWYSTERTNVSRADDLLEHGDVQQAAWLMQRTWPRMHEARPVASSLSVIADGVRVMALASVRSEGSVRSGLGWSSWTPAERSQNVAWGVSRLRMLAAANPSSDVAKTDLGEALARSPSTRDEGRNMLEALDSSNAITSPEGYAALAFVRSEEGDTDTAAIATDECRRHASNAEVQCAYAPVEAPLTAAR